jgi:Ca2+-binding EF-hand superfamily protein
VEDLRLQFALHDKYSSDEIDSIFSALDMTGSGTISWTEFLASTIETLGPVSAEEFSSAFDHLDLDSSGYISTGNLKDILGGKLSQKMLDRIIDEADIIGDHKVWKDEFMALAKESFADASDEEDDQREKDVTDTIRTGSEGRRGHAASCFAEFDYVNAESLNCIQAAIDAEQLPQSNLDLLPWDINGDDLGVSQFVIEKEKSVRKVRQLV